MGEVHAGGRTSPPDGVERDADGFARTPLATASREARKLMTGKEKRIQRVIVHREKELDRRVGELGEARAAAERVENAVARAEQSLERAAAEREAMSEQTMSASDWREANEWLESNRRTHAAMTKELQRANQHVEAKQTNVLTARRALKGVELYETRLKEEVARAEDKADQRLQDELARSRTAQKRGKS